MNIEKEIMLTAEEAVEFHRLRQDLGDLARSMSRINLQLLIGAGLQLGGLLGVLAQLFEVADARFATATVLPLWVGFGVIWHGCQRRRALMPKLLEAHRQLTKWVIRTRGARGESIPAWLLMDGK